MEELGAIEIEIEFNNGKVESSNVEIKSSEYNYIAGSLGFTASSNSSENEELLIN